MLACLYSFSGEKALPYFCKIAFNQVTQDWVIAGSLLQFASQPQLLRISNSCLSSKVFYDRAEVRATGAMALPPVICNIL